MSMRSLAKSSSSGREIVETMWGLDGLPERSAHALERWLQFLATLALDEWIVIGCRCKSRDGQAVASACARVETAIADHRLDVAAWFIRDAVDTVAQIVRPQAVRRSRRAQSRLALALAAAQWAALAVATEQWLAPGDRASLCAPFTSERQAGNQFAASDAVPLSALAPGSRSSSSVAIAGTRRTKTLPPPSRS